MLGFFVGASLPGDKELLLLVSLPALENGSAVMARNGFSGCTLHAGTAPWSLCSSQQIL